MRDDLRPCHQWMDGSADSMLTRYSLLETVPRSSNALGDSHMILK